MYGFCVKSLEGKVLRTIAPLRTAPVLILCALMVMSSFPVQAVLVGVGNEGSPMDLLASEISTLPAGDITTTPSRTSIMDERAPVGFSGLSWKPVVPLNKVTFVGNDDKSYLDEYGYLASIPSTVFHVPGQDVLYSNPVLIYEPNKGLPQSQYALEGEQSVHYFMDDWANVTGGPDAMDFICMKSANKSAVLSSWGQALKTSKDYGCPSPDQLANDISFYNWEEAPTAVVAVIQPNLPAWNIPSSGKANGTLDASMILIGSNFAGNVDVGIGPLAYHNFTVPKSQVYISSWMSWSGNGKDPDLQLYDWQLGEAGASEVWNPASGAYEYIEGYLYNPGPWGFAITYMPTENVTDSIMSVNPVAYTISSTTYPGKNYKIPDKVPFGAQNLTLTLTGDDPTKPLGLVLRDESGAKVATSFANSNVQTIKLDKPGEGYYNYTVMKLQNYTTEAYFNVTWSWDQQRNPDEGPSFGSASHGAVIGSALGAPMFYASPSGITKASTDTMRRLGVHKVILVDFNNRSKGKVLSALVPYFTVTDELYDMNASFGYVKNITGSNAVVFTTTNDWNYWFVDQPAVGTEPYTNHIGPATFAAAQHGTAPLITEMYPETSQAASYFREYWIENYGSREPAVVGNLVLEGKSVYGLLGKLGLDGPGNETILTVADQFDIGLGFDRTFVGVSYPGRIMGSPVDAAAWVARSTFYPYIIYANPAMDPQGLLMINGSNSTRVGGNLQITPGGQEKFTYPILQTWVCYLNRFNERASKYWGLNYSTADGFTPYWSPSPDAIDNGVNAARGRPGQYYGDMSGPEIIPYYAAKGGYDSVFSSDFSDTMNNLNRGSLLWVELMHGGNGGSGVTGFWNSGQAEPDPWRAYETGGSTADPDTRAMNKVNGLDNQVSTSENDRDGVVIAILEQSHTSIVDGYSYNNSLSNLHSTGFIAGSCLIAATYLQLAMIRHGTVFQVIDPWLTSWYVDFAMESMVKYIAMNMSVGEAYSRANQHVGIGYLDNHWWWDIYENVVYFGDPGLHMYTPAFGWSKPQNQSYSKDLVIGGEHSPFGAPHHIKVEGLKLLDGDNDGTGNMTLVFAALRPYTFELSVRDPNGLSQIADTSLAFDQGNISLKYKWNSSADAVTEVADPTGLGVIDFKTTDASDDGLCVYTINFKVKLGWSYPHENLTGLFASAFESDGTQVDRAFPSVYQVENHLVLVGNLTAVADIHGDLSQGDWVQGGEGINWGNITVAYKGFPNVTPPTGDWNITIDDGNTNWGFQPEPGKRLSAMTYVTKDTRMADLVRFSIGLVPKQCDASNLTFLVRIDATPPSAPRNLTVHADAFNDTATSLDNDAQVFITWDPPIENESGIANYYLTDSDGNCTGVLPGNATSFGPCNATGDHVLNVTARAVDKVGNKGPSTNSSIRIDRIPVVFFRDISVSWYTNRTVYALAEVKDDGLAGLSGASVEYQIGIENQTRNVTWGNWNRMKGVNDTPPDVWVELNVTITVKVDGTYRVRWRASDLAGNGPIISEEHVFHVDTTPPVIELIQPLDNKWYDGPSVHVRLLVYDFMSSVDLFSISYRTSYKGNWSEWLDNDIGCDYDGRKFTCGFSVDLPEGDDNQIEVRAIDNAESGWNTTGPHAIRINMGQKIKIASPLNGTVFKAKDIVRLEASVLENKDGDPLNFTWVAQVGGYLGSGPVLEFKAKDKLTYQVHNITLVANDGHGHNTSVSVQIEVKKPPAPKHSWLQSNLWWILLVIVLMAVTCIVAVFLVFKRRRKATPQVPAPPAQTAKTVQGLPGPPTETGPPATPPGGPPQKP